MSVTTPTLVFRTFPVSTGVGDPAPAPAPLPPGTIREIIGQLPVMFGDGAGDGEEGIGIPGAQGATGATGPSGSGGSGGSFPAFFVETTDGEDGLTVPGARGAAGTAGASGVNGTSVPGINGEDGEDGLTILLPSSVRTKTVGIVFDGGGSPPTVGSVGYFVCQDSGTIDQWSIIADVSGSAVVDVWKAAGAIPTNANTIAGSEKLTLSAQQLANDTSLTTWSTAVSSGDVFGFELESVSTCTRLTCEVRITLTP